MISGEPSTFIFVVGNKLLGLDLAQVDRVLPAAQLLDPPQSSPGLAGFLNYRGQVIPILNLRELLGLPAMDLRSSDRIVLARAWNAPVGLIVDEALGVHEADRMQPFLAELEALSICPAIEGFVQVGEKMVIIHNLEKFLASSLAVLATSLQGETHSLGKQTP